MAVAQSQVPLQTQPPSQAPAASAPPPSSLAVYPQFIAQQPEQIVLKENVLSLSGDSFSIKTVDGRVMFQVKGEYLTLSGRKHVMDAQGNALFDIRKELISLHTTFYAINPQGQRFFQVKSKFSIGSSKAIGSFTNIDGTPVELLMKGDFFDTKAQITNTASGQPVATIDRQYFNAAQLLGGQQTYVVTVQPGIDMALIVAMCICLDEKRNEK